MILSSVTIIIRMKKFLKLWLFSILNSLIALIHSKIFQVVVLGSN